MAIPFSNPPENPLNFQKFKNNPKNLNLEKLNKINPNNQSNLKSFWAFLSSIFLYISIFYIFNLSPSTLFCTTKFWFFISNTLVLIIAADFVAFSSSKKNDFYDEYVEKSSNNTTLIPSFDDKIVEKTMVSDDMTEEEKPHEKIINMLETSTSIDDHKNHKTIEYEPQIPTIKEKDDGPKSPNQEKTEEKRKAKCYRSNSEKAITMAAAAEEREGKLVLQRTLSERERNDEEPKLLEENEFSRMSDEELNKRVEEFIQRFNRQIRLQAVKNRRNLEMINAI